MGKKRWPLISGDKCFQYELNTFFPRNTNLMSETSPVLQKDKQKTLGLVNTRTINIQRGRVHIFFYFHLK